MKIARRPRKPKRRAPGVYLQSKFLIAASHCIGPLLEMGSLIVRFFCRSGFGAAKITTYSVECCAFKVFTEKRENGHTGGKISFE